MDSETNGDALQSTLDEIAHLLIEPSRLAVLKDSEVRLGGYEAVCLATLDGSSKVAVKQVQIIQAKSIRVLVAMRLARELKTWAKAQHPNVLTLVGYYLSENYGCAQLVSPYMPNGNIIDYIKRTQPSTEVRLGFARSVTLGMAYLHNSDPPICHGDLKPANVLINDKPDAVLCDFGLATFVESSGTSSGLITSRTIKGSTRYMSPELFQDPGAKPTLKGDVWAWACTVFEIITDCIPYSNSLSDSSVVLAIAQGSPPGSSEPLNNLALNVDMPLRSALDTLRTLFSECWSFKPSERPSFSSILDDLQHGFREPVSGLSQEELSKHLSQTQRDLSPSVFDPRSLEKRKLSLTKSSPAHPTGNSRKAITQPGAPSTTSSTPFPPRQYIADYSRSLRNRLNSSISKFTTAPVVQATPTSGRVDPGKTLIPQQLEVPPFCDAVPTKLVAETEGADDAPAIGRSLETIASPPHVGQGIHTPPMEPPRPARHSSAPPGVTMSSRMNNPPTILERPLQRSPAQTELPLEPTGPEPRVHPADSVPPRIPWLRRRLFSRADSLAASKSPIGQAPLPPALASHQSFLLDNVDAAATPTYGPKASGLGGKRILSSLSSIFTRRQPYSRSATAPELDRIVSNNNPASSPRTSRHLDLPDIPDQNAVKFSLKATVRRLIDTFADSGRGPGSSTATALPTA